MTIVDWLRDYENRLTESAERGRGVGEVEGRGLCDGLRVFGGDLMTQHKDYYVT